LETKEKAAAGCKQEEINSFAAIYNTGKLMPSAFSELGRLSVKTIYRWAKELLASHGDFAVLVPEYGTGRRKQIDPAVMDVLLGFCLMITSLRLKLQ